VNILREFFPLSAKVNNGKSFIITTVLYLIISAVTGFVLNFFVGIPFIGVAIGFISSLIDLYCLAGIVVSILFLSKCA